MKAFYDILHLILDVDSEQGEFICLEEVMKTLLVICAVWLTITVYSSSQSSSRYGADQML